MVIADKPGEETYATVTIYSMLLKKKEKRIKLKLHMYIQSHPTRRHSSIVNIRPAIPTIIVFFPIVWQVI